MSTSSLRTLVLGGTGLLGYHAVREITSRGHTASVLATTQPPDGLLPDGVRVIVADLDACSDDQVRAELAGCDAVVFAIGKDDRIIPPRPAYEFFHRANVAPALRVVRLARECGVSRGVVCSSMMAYFDRIWPDLELARHHPYVRVRREQEVATLAAAGDDLALTILELPYVFGVVPGRRPFWDDLVRLADSRMPLLGANGGTNAVAVQHAGEAIAGALERSYHGTALVGDENVSWNDLMERVATALGRSRRAHTTPDVVLQVSTYVMHASRVLRGVEGGLHQPRLARALNRGFYFDPAPYRSMLGYGSGGLDSAIADTVDALADGRHRASFSGVRPSGLPVLARRACD